MAIITNNRLRKQRLFYSGIKGAILSEAPVQIIDISHQISPFNIQEGAYILKNTPSFSGRNDS